MLKTDDETKIGTHVFAKFGPGPYRFVGAVYDNKGTGCQHCGMGINIVCMVACSDGRTFKVGSSCIEKTGDKGLWQAFKSSPQKRAIDRDRRNALARSKQTQVNGWLSDDNIVAKLKSFPHPIKWRADQNDTRHDWAVWMMTNSGNTGRSKVHSFIKKYCT